MSMKIIWSTTRSACKTYRRPHTHVMRKIGGTRSEACFTVCVLCIPVPVIPFTHFQLIYVCQSGSQHYGESVRLNMDQLSRQGNQTLSLQDIVFITALTFTTYLGQLVLQQLELQRSRTVYKLKDDQECGITGGDNYNQ